jgi:hypothetical protein
MENIQKFALDSASLKSEVMGTEVQPSITLPLFMEYDNTTGQCVELILRIITYYNIFHSF